jgi:S1-C subfamily serine protease
MISKCTYCGALLSCEQPEGTEVDCAACGRAFVAIPVVCEQCRVCKKYYELPAVRPESIECDNCGHIILLGPPSSLPYRKSHRLVYSIAAVSLLAISFSALWFFAYQKESTNLVSVPPEPAASFVNVEPNIENAEVAPPTSLVGQNIADVDHPIDRISQEDSNSHYEPPNIALRMPAYEAPSENIPEIEDAPQVSTTISEPIVSNTPPEYIDVPIVETEPINEINPLHALVSIKTDLGHGTGFIVEHDGKKYILTNQHVLEALKYISIRLYDGTVIRPSRVELNKSIDLARFDITGSPLPALSLESYAPNLKDSISVVGDSGGEGVFTELRGNILGVGPDKLEVSADFISGNSGSPILSANRKVLGVATYVLSRTAAPEFVTTGTRFEKARRFGMRYDPNSQWNAISVSELLRQQAVLTEVENYLINVLSVMFCWVGDASLQGKARAYFESCVTRPMTRHYYDTQWTEHVSIFADRYARYWIKRFKTNSDDGRLSLTQTMLGTILVDLSEKPKNKLKRQYWASDALRERAKYLEECMALFTKECSAITKRAGWDKCVIEDALKRNRRPDKEPVTPSFPFFYEESTE